MREMLGLAHQGRHPADRRKRSREGQRLNHETENFCDRLDGRQRLDLQRLLQEQSVLTPNPP
jgi:hypothetical protein